MTYSHAPGASRGSLVRPLAAGQVPCVANPTGRYHLPSRIGECGPCRDSKAKAPSGAGSKVSGPKTLASSTPPAPKGPRPGERHERALSEALTAAGFRVYNFLGWMRETFAGGPDVWVEQFPWGMSLDPQRRFRSDFACPTEWTLLEIEGDAHAVKKQRKGDVLRRQLAEGAGFRVLSVLPEQVADGSAIALVRASLGRRATKGGAK